jgi:hypothetical protein
MKVMDNLYSYVLWYNTFTKVWHGIPRSNYTEFFSDSSKNEGVITAKTVDALIAKIEKA